MEVLIVMASRLLRISLVALILCLAFCKTDRDSSTYDAASGNDLVENDDNNSQSNQECRYSAGREFPGKPSYSEEPKFTDDYISGFFSRVFTVESQPAPKAANDVTWYFSMKGTTEKSQATVYFLFMKPWILSDQVGKTFGLTKWSKYSPDCFGEGNEPMLMDETVLRDEEGKLVLVSAGVPIDSTGSVHIPTDLTPEFEVNWVDVDCPVLMNIPYPKTSVGIQLKEVDENKASIVVKSGERKSIVIMDQEYVLAVDYAWVPKPWTTSICTWTSWTLYQKGFFLQDESVYP